ncbi:MAG: hypothetical protein ABL982_10700 [Vicinamibacterales bacterium]
MSRRPKFALLKFPAKKAEPTATPATPDAVALIEAVKRLSVNDPQRIVELLFLTERMEFNVAEGRRR